MSGGSFSLLRRCALVLAAAGAALAALAPLSTSATPLLTVVVSTSCPSGAICAGDAELTPGLHSTDAAVACSVAELPTQEGKVIETSVLCSLQGSLDGLYYYSNSKTSSGIQPAEVAGVVSNLPLQPYLLCVLGQYMLNDANHTVVSSGFVCNTGNAPPL